MTLKKNPNYKIPFVELENEFAILNDDENRYKMKKN